MTAPAPQKVRILLVDDEPDYVEPVAFWLTSQGHRVTTVENGVKALEALTKQEFDVVFLDVNMPEMNGIETLKRLRDTNKTLPVIMVTAAYQDEFKFTEAKALGISGYFPKGSPLTQLSHVLDVALRMLRKPGPPSG